jgi:hypothetical protein
MANWRSAKPPLLKYMGRGAQQFVSKIIENQGVGQ